MRRGGRAVLSRAAASLEQRPSDVVDQRNTSSRGAVVLVTDGKELTRKSRPGDTGTKEERMQRRGKSERKPLDVKGDEDRMERARMGTSLLRTSLIAKALKVGVGSGGKEFGSVERARSASRGIEGGGCGQTDQVAVLQSRLQMGAMIKMPPECAKWPESFQLFASTFVGFSSKTSTMLHGTQDRLHINFVCACRPSVDTTDSIIQSEYLCFSSRSSTLLDSPSMPLGQGLRNDAAYADLETHRTPCGSANALVPPGEDDEREYPMLPPTGDAASLCLTDSS
ncbi:hypothetical protein B0H16DRAFT_1456049 [Mycena metata]|uniref:Uncharacterized protein n=1 Tax=Mycena metata TaxID=1033252 RepID=A0AAD7NHJ1_9AGAR|nr:hypothetical protein B0H16DRAFT_1456049 [Mycena metata]